MFFFYFSWKNKVLLYSTWLRVLTKPKAEKFFLMETMGDNTIQWNNIFMLLLL
jgi:hypothetical protein